MTKTPKIYLDMQRLEKLGLYYEVSKTVLTVFDSDKYIVGTIVYWPDKTEYVFMDYCAAAKIFTRDWFFKCLIRLTM